MTRAYITNQKSKSLTIIDTRTLTTESLAISGLNRPEAVAVSPDGEQLYVTNTSTGDQVAILRTARPSDTPQTVAIAKGNPTGVVFAPDGGRAYLINPGDDFLSILDTARPTTAPVTVQLGNEADPAGLAVSPDGRVIYVVHDAPGADLGIMKLIDARNPTAEPRTVPLPARPGGVAVTPDGSRIYVTLDNDTVMIFDAGDPTSRSATLRVGDEPREVGISPDGTRAYVLNEYSNTVSVINTGMS